MAALTYRRVTVVVSHKWIESSQSSPASAQRLRGIASEATDLEQTREIKHTLDRIAVVLPQAQIITKPLADISASPGEGRACDDHGAAGRTTSQHRVARVRAHHAAVDVVDIKLDMAVVMHDIGV